LIFVILIQPVAAASRLERPPVAAAEEAAPAARLQLPADAASSPLAEVAQQQVQAQAARVEPAPVAVGTPLPPGTVKVVASSPAQATALTLNGQHTVYLPLTLKGMPSQSRPQDIALDAEIWMEATQDWPERELMTIPNFGTVLIRYPALWRATSSTTLDERSFQLADQAHRIVVSVRPYEQPELYDSCQAVNYPEIERLAAAGYDLQEITVKGIPAWEVTPDTLDSEVCRKVLVALDEGLIEFQLQAVDTNSCADQDTFDLILASLQVRVDTELQSEPIDEQGPVSPQAISARDYDRTAARSYQTNWCDQRNNNDDCYIICSTGACGTSGAGCDGAHYLAHVMQAGGFPIHWNAGQNHGSTIIRSITSQRNYVLGFSDVSAGTSATARSKLKPSDIIYINGGSWCWGLAVWRMDGNTPYVSSHSVERCDRRYDYLSCGSNHYYEYVHIDANEDHAQPRINSGLSLSPSTQELSQTVTAAFNVHNYGGKSASLQLRVTTPLGDFATTSCTLAVGGNCGYSQSREFYQTGSVNAYAQMSVDGGSWQNIPVESGINPVELNIVLPADVKISSAMTLSPRELDHNGGAVQAQFSVQNYGDVETTEKFRARVTPGAVTFVETADVTLNTNQTYDYSDSQTFSQVGVYQAIAEHTVDGDWTALIGNGSDYVRVKEPPPDKPWWQTAYPTTCGFAGEPVNTSTGNYFYDSTDLREDTPTPFLEVNRWYNALTAPRFAGPFGYGSAWTYDMAITWRPDKTALVRMADGHPGYFIGEIDASDPLTMSGTYYGQEHDIGNILVRHADGTAVLTTPDQKLYHFDDTGRIVSVAGQNSAEITVVYSDALPSQLVHSAGVTYTLTYSGSLITNIASSNGRAVTYTYTISDNLETVTLPDGANYTYIYDQNHRLIEARDPNGHAYVRNVYDDEGRVIRQYDQTGQISTFSYESQIAGTRSFTDVLGNVITHTYDANNYLIGEIDALGNVITYTRDVQGNILARHDENGNIWRYTYDDRGNKLSETNPLTHTWAFTYDAQNNLTSKTDPLGNVFIYEYDADGNLVRTLDPVGNTREYSYNADGKLVWERDETGAQVWYEHNEMGWNTAITDALGSVTQFGYDNFGRQTVITDANGNVAYSVYDEIGQLIESIDPMGTVVTFTYDLMGNLIAESDGLGNIKTYTYDEYTRMIAETDFNGNTTRYGYDALGRRTVVTDALGYTTVITYDAPGKITARKAPDGAVVQYKYDPVGNLIRETDALNRVTEYVYDAAGQLIETREPCEACIGGVAISTTAYDAAGRIITEVDPLGAVIHYGYDPLGRLAIVTDTYGYTMTTAYDPLGRIIQQVDALGAITHHEYDIVGNLITTTNVLGYQSTNAYDAVGNLLQVVNERGYTTTFAYNAKDQLIAITDADGSVTQHTYDGLGRLIATTDALSRTTTYDYDPAGNLIAITDPLNRTSFTEYDAKNRPVREIDALGNVSTTAYDAVGRVLSETNALSGTWYMTYDVVGRLITEQSPLGHTTVYTYDSADNLIAQQDPAGAVWRYAYDANGNLVEKIDPLGEIHRTEYNLLNWPVRRIDPLGAITTYEYDRGGQVVKVVEPNQAITHYEYDILGYRVKETNALGYTRVYTFNAVGDLVAEQDELGNVTAYTYDALNRLIAQTDPFSHTLHILYDAVGQMVAEVDYKGYATYYSYDAVGNEIAVTDALSHTIQTDYDALNRPIAITDPLSGTTRMAYDALGQVISDTSPAGRTTQYIYDADGRPIRSVDPLGHSWYTDYDAADRPIREIDPLGRSQTTTYDALGQVLAKTDPLSRTTRYTYDPMSRLTQVIGPDGTTQRYTYDSMGNVLTEQDGNNNITRYQYDVLGNLLRKTDPLGRTWRYRYDAKRNLTDISTPAGQRITQAYDSLDRLVSKTHDGTEVVAYAYDANGNRRVMTDTLGVTTYVYDARNQLTASLDPQGRLVQVTYDAMGEKTGLIYPDGAHMYYAYDADGILLQVAAPDDGVTHYLPDALGRTVEMTQANGVVVNTVYDAVGNEKNITQRGADGVVFAQHIYTVDAADRRTQIVELLPQGTVTTTYAYDDLDRLTASIASDGRETYYAFDSAGNRIRQWGARIRNEITEQYEIVYSYNAANQILRTVDSVTGITTYSYDANGNRIGERAFERWVDYQYDPENRMTEARVRVWNNAQWEYKNGIYERYTYDGDGRRVQRETMSVALGNVILRRSYRYDDTGRGWNVLQTYDTAGTVTERQFLYDVDLHKLAYWDGSQTSYFQNNAQGSVLGAIDGSGLLSSSLMRYGDYGEELLSEDVLPTEDGFTGYERDLYTGLNYARHRYYDAATGTFLTKDPYPANQTALLELNRYLYAQADPTNRTDPLGLWSLRGALNKVVGSRVRSAAQSVQRRVTRTTQRVKQTVRRAKRTVQTVSRTASRVVSRTYRRSRQRVTQSAQRFVNKTRQTARFVGTFAKNCGQRALQQVRNVTQAVSESQVRQWVKESQSITVEKAVYKAILILINDLASAKPQADAWIDEHKDTIRQVAEDEEVDPNILGGLIHNEIVHNRLKSRIANKVGQWTFGKLGSPTYGESQINVDDYMVDFPEVCSKGDFKLLDQYHRNQCIKLLETPEGGIRASAQLFKVKVNKSTKPERPDPDDITRFAIGLYHGAFEGLREAQKDYHSDSGSSGEYAKNPDVYQYDNIETYLKLRTKNRIEAVFNYDLPE